MIDSLKKKKKKLASTKVEPKYCITFGAVFNLGSLFKLETCCKDSKTLLNTL